ncbi:MAG: ABC transporter permease subunit [Dehalococcoidia bacterium]
MTESRGEVFDLGYQHYDGPREGRSRARKAVFWNGVRTVLGLGRGPKSKILPILLFVAAMLPAVIFAMILSVAGPAADFIPGPGDYYRVVSLVLLIFSAISAPELLAPDRRDRVIDLYLVRPLTSTDYVIGRLLAFFAVVLVLVYSGQIVLQVALILTSSDPLDFISENWLDIPRFLGVGVLVALYMAALPMAVAAFTDRRAIASAFVIGLFIISSGMADGLAGEQCHVAAGGEGHFECEPVTGDAAKWFSLISIRDVPIRVNDLVFSTDEDDGPPAAVAARDLPPVVPIAVYVLLTGGPLAALWWRYRRIQI